MNLNSIFQGRKKNRRRVGRGIGSGRGKTCGRGHKGQKSRSGSTRRSLFEGGQMPLHRRIPKRGFTNCPFKKEYTPINLYRLSCFLDGEAVSEETLKERGIISGKYTAVKLLGKGDIDVKLKVDVSAISSSAKEKILAKGGEVVEH